MFPWPRPCLEVAHAVAARTQHSKVSWRVVLAVLIDVVHLENLWNLVPSAVKTRFDFDSLSIVTRGGRGVVVGWTDRLETKLGAQRIAMTPARAKPQARLATVAIFLGRAIVSRLAEGALAVGFSCWFGL